MKVDVDLITRDAEYCQQVATVLGRHLTKSSYVQAMRKVMQQTKKRQIGGVIVRRVIWRKLLVASHELQLVPRDDWKFPDEFGV